MSSLLKWIFTKKQLGFTLIELMVVIAIIGLVFAIIITSAAAVKRNSRDTQRQSDLKTIQSALEQYNADQTFYPCSTASLSPACTSALSLVTSTSITNSLGNPTSITCPGTNCRTYLNSVPTDPTTGTTTPYVYKAFSSTNGSCDNSTNMCVKYCLYGYLENGGSNFAASPCDSTNVPAGGYNFSVSQP